MCLMLIFCFASITVAVSQILNIHFSQSLKEMWSCKYFHVNVTRVTEDKISTYPVEVRCDVHPQLTVASVLRSRERILKGETISFPIMPPCEGYQAIIIYNTRQCDRVTLRNNKEESLVKPDHNYAAVCLHHKKGDSYTVSFIPGTDVDYDPRDPHEGENLFFIKFVKLFGN